ncbi:MAG TPA: ferrochelatase [Deltaproteobacteria bacterium]|nr:MAG: ferrochelatase [Deltaproteobacteria bacterium GWA2_45_12]HBF13743.1 ferrochelatase [Deltaproteobacteria bacterium]
MKGLLLINLGSPDAPDVPSVRHYLREFLSDPFVIDINPVARWLLVNTVIAPFRSPKSAKAYQKVWMKEGSPLVVYSENLTGKVQEKLGDYVVELGMRYGKPSIREAIEKLLMQGIDELVVFPLYPQYALSSTETAVVEVNKVLGSRSRPAIPIKFIPPFYNHPAFIKAFAQRGREALQDFRPDHVLFSFHGLPKRHVIKALPQDYRVQCAATAGGIAKELGLCTLPVPYSISFQSRLGRTPWIEPFTDVVLSELPKKGIKKLAVFCPSFVADCLETLEEIGIRGRETFQQNGGEDLRLVPCPNDSPLWVEAIYKLVMGSGFLK